ncbi:MAG: MerR family transcriptional regulator [Actinopolymorphaceae bacterium]
MSTNDTRRTALTISEFGRRSGLSHKALRLYDLSGLLPPASVDPVNGYRLYSADQLERARRISLLRQLDMPLATVGEVLAGSDEDAVVALDRWWSAQEESMRVKRGSLAYLRAQLTRTAAAEAAAYDLRLRDVPETKVAALTCEVDQSALVSTTRGTAEKIRQHLENAGATPTNEVWMIFHGLVTPDSAAPVEVCVPFTGRADPAGPIVLRIEPGHTEAYCTVTRDECFYPRIMLAYDAVESWVLRSGMPTAGSPREVYFAEWCEIEGTDPFCHVAQPVRRSV